ncbi:MauE/DoxX family redox-associated membrane protein [Pinibacter aurantiacus]|jgi:hypothetical protein|uniref:Methylamine utilisation protein MauE domain-containing protein n=1 Tax=Pinibacter aurantiacus TaxID=2851599 RepID=A0A9E2SDU6_9BACT|nr:MauE/DoxX family redox-associated membrane protein [Pinibacter aurantiacus]MBV4358775.1 hypothetical protein [Pinibacter aurantiacus]
MRKIILSLTSALFILLFAYTAIDKLMHLRLFYQNLRESILLQPLAPILGLSIPVMELAVTALLFIPMYRSKGFLLATFLMLLFSLYVGYMLAFAEHLPCSCGGLISTMTWQQHLLFNLFCCMIAFACWRLSIQRSNTKPHCNTLDASSSTIRAGKAEHL